MSGLSEICSFKVVRRIVPVAIHCDLRMEKAVWHIARICRKSWELRCSRMLILMARCTLCVHFDWNFCVLSESSTVPLAKLP
jgi:hypothetical protein